MVYKKNKEDLNNLNEQLFYTNLPDKVFIGVNYNGLSIFDERNCLLKIGYLIYKDLKDIIDFYYDHKSFIFECNLLNPKGKKGYKRFRLYTI